jgi:quinol---cytochrome c reductase iron-sulfur subunit, bacillus type
MTMPDGLSRRAMFAKIGAFFTGAVGLMLVVPMTRYLLSPIIRERSSSSDHWLVLGSLDQFPVGETRLATYRNPIVGPSDGVTADVACWVRRVDEGTVQVFAVDCAHLGCPVRWFAASGLFLCPCHGGAYYADGARASGPPVRGLFEYDHKTEQGRLLIKVGDMPTPGRSAGLSATRPPCA